jgi:hypothetical protein
VADTLDQLTNQVNALYANCNSISAIVNQLLESQPTYSTQLIELAAQVNTILSQQKTDSGNISILNTEVAQLIYYQNLSILGQNNTTFNAATLTESTNIVSTSPISINGSISGNITYSIIGNSQYNKIIYSFNNYQSASQSLPFPNSLLSPLVNSDGIIISQYSVSDSELTINQTTLALNGSLVVEGLVSQNNLSPVIDAPTSGSYQIYFNEIGQYKKYLIYLNNYVNDTGNVSNITFNIPFTNVPFFSNASNAAATIDTSGITLKSSSNPLNGYLIAEGW